MRSFFGPFGPGRRLRWGENNVRYFRLHSTACRCSRVEGFRTMAERRVRARRMNRVHKPAMIRSAGRSLGARLRPRLRIQQLVPNQRGFGNNGAESVGPCQPDNGDDQMKEKDEKWRIPGNRINTSKSRHSGNLIIRHAQALPRLPYRQ